MFDSTWLLLAGCLAMFMHLGFALVETGLCRAKNAAHTMSMNLMVYVLACLAFWGFGFALGWGNSMHGPTRWDTYIYEGGEDRGILDHGLGLGPAADAVGHSASGYRYGLLGWKGFFLGGVENHLVLPLFFFTMVAMSVAAAIPTGAMAERWSWRNFCLYGIWFVLLFSIHANWVWGGGWLPKRASIGNSATASVDFAGSGVIHAFGGVVALAGRLAIGPRLGKYQRGRPQPFPAIMSPWSWPVPWCWPWDGLV